MMKKGRESWGERELPGRGGAGGPLSLPSWVMVDGAEGRGGGKRRHRCPRLVTAHKGIWRPPSSTPHHPPTHPPARFKEPFIILHIRRDTMVGLWGEGFGGCGAFPVQTKCCLKMKKGYGNESQHCV